VRRNPFTEEGNMTYASTSIDRRAAYYARCAELIANDPLDFYCRAEKGRQYLAARCVPDPIEPMQATPVLSALFGIAARRNAKMQSRRPIDVAQDLFRPDTIAA
jgi:hypothetical protein